MGRLFLDANVLFSAAYRSDAGLLELWKLRDVVLCSSRYALEEARVNFSNEGQRARLVRLTEKVQFFDALVRNRGPRYDFREDLGAYMVVECKDWSKPVSSKEVGWFVNKLLTQECKAGILFSSEGITGDATKDGGEVRYAALSLLKA